jgi:hypothetical protein
MSETINNYEFDLAYGSYKTYVNELRGVYHRLIWNFPNHERVKFWEKRKEYWQNYDTINLGYKAFDSIQALDTEMLKILPEAILAEDLEVELLRNKKAMSETEYLLSTKPNAESLAKSIKQAEDGTDLIQFDPTKSE